MKLSIGMCLLLLGSISIWPAKAQTRETYGGLLTRDVAANKLPGPQHLRDYVSDGNLRLGLRDAVTLTLENNSAVRIQETDVETNKFAVLRTYQPFDPQLQSVVDVNRYSYAGSNQLQGIGSSGNATLNSLTQSVRVNYAQTI